MILQSLAGLPAKVVTKGYHLGAIPHRANQLRVAADWLVNLVSRPTATQLGLVQESAAQLRSEYSDKLSRPAGATAIPPTRRRSARPPPCTAWKPRALGWWLRCRGWAERR